MISGGQVLDWKHAEMYEADKVADWRTDSAKVLVWLHLVFIQALPLMTPISRKGDSTWHSAKFVFHEHVNVASTQWSRCQRKLKDQYTLSCPIKCRVGGCHALLSRSCLLQLMLMNLSTCSKSTSSNNSVPEYHNIFRNVSQMWIRSFANSDYDALWFICKYSTGCYSTDCSFTVSILMVVQITFLYWVSWIKLTNEQACDSLCKWKVLVGSVTRLHSFREMF